MRNEVRWERMFPDELEQAFSACPVLYLTYGMCEPHGPQNTLGLDALKAHAIACLAAQRYGGIVAPPDYWHIHELSGYAGWAAKYIGEVPRSWMTAMPPWQHFKNVLYQLRTADALGFEAVILLTGHYGPNWEDLNTLVDIVRPRIGARLYSLPDFEVNVPGFDGRAMDHAGKVETSQLWALEPDCVDMSRLPEPDAPGPHLAMGSDAPESSRREGERMVADQARVLGDKARELREAFQAEKPSVRLRTFDEVEAIWSELVEPVLSEFITMKVWGDCPFPAANSVWAANASSNRIKP